MRGFEASVRDTGRAQAGKVGLKYRGHQPQQGAHAHTTGEPQVTQGTQLVVVCCVCKLGTSLSGKPSFVKPSPSFQHDGMGPLDRAGGGDSPSP